MQKYNISEEQLRRILEEVRKLRKKKKIEDANDSEDNNRLISLNNNWQINKRVFQYSGDEKFYTFIHSATDKLIADKTTVNNPNV
jgi:CRISPR/Cas system CSM-associated protein Csm2 small subunit